MTIFIWIIYAFWFVLIAYLIFSAMGVKPETQEHLAQSFGLLLAIIVAFLLPHLPIFHFVNFAPVNSVVSSIGVILCAAGIAFVAWARQHLGKNWSQTVAVKKGHELVTSGPYRYVRHPMYAGRPSRVYRFGGCLWRRLDLSARHPRWPFSLAGGRGRQAHGTTISE